MDKEKEIKMSLAELLSGKPIGIMGSCNVELTDTEREQALAAALEHKRNIAEHEEKVARRRMIDNEIGRQWNSKELFDYISWRAAAKLNIPFVVDDKNHQVLRILTRYFTCDPRFEKMGDGWSLDKGILLAGNVGTGKTTIMKLLNANKRASFQLISCRKLSDMFNDIGPEVLHKYGRLMSVPTSIDSFYQGQIGLCFDDLGTERQGKRYGDSANVMEQIILNRYDNQDIPWYYTHITTNLTVEEIEHHYGTRVRSRMREMFNLVTLEGEDRRR